MTTDTLRDSTSATPDSTHVRGEDTRDSSRTPSDADVTPLQSPLRAFAAIKPLLWLAPLLGGLMLLVHFWRVGYLPALSFAELGVVLGAFGLFVAVGVVAFLMLVLLPAVAVLHWTELSLLPAPPRVAAQPVARRRRSLSRRPLPVVDADAGPIKRRTFSMRMWPGGFGMFWVACATAFTLTLVALLVVSKHLDPAWRGWPVTVLLWGGMAVSFCINFFAESGWCTRRLKTIRKPLPQFLMLLSLYVFLWPAWLIFLYSFDALPQSVAGWSMLGFLACVLVPVTHWFWYATLRGPWRIVATPRVFTSVFVLLFSGIWLPLLDGAASTFGFGMMRGADLVLTERGCAIVQEALPEQRCVPDAAAAAGAQKQSTRVARHDKTAVATGAQGDTRGPTQAHGQTSARVEVRQDAQSTTRFDVQAGAPVYRLRGVDVLTRIGAEYVIAPRGGIDDHTLPRATLPAEDVLALVRRQRMR